MSDNFLYVQAQSFTLYGAGAVIGDTSVILTSFQDIDGTNLTMTDFGSLGFITIDPGNGSSEEQACFTGVTQNSNGTATLTGIKNVSFKYPYTQTSGLSKTHLGGATVVISNTAGFYDQLTSKSDDETITGVYTFTQFPQKSGTTTPTSSAELAPKAYVDSVAGGNANYDQNIISGVAGETLAAGKLVYLKTADGRWWLTDATSATTLDGTKIGFAQATATAGNAVNIVIGGIDKNQSALTAGVTYFASNTPGSIASSAGTVTRAIGKGLTTTSIILDPLFVTTPTQNEKNAMAGTSGIAVSSTNKLVDSRDETRNLSEVAYAVDSGSANTYAITLSPIATAYTAGMTVRVKIANSSTATSTLNVNTLGAKTIKKLNGSTDITKGDLVSGNTYTFIYDGTNFVVSVDSQYANGVLATSGASGATAITTGFKPRIIRMSWSYIMVGNAGTGQAFGSGTWIGGVYAESFIANTGTSGSAITPTATSNTTAIVSGTANTNVAAFTGAIGTLTDTGFTLTLSQTPGNTSLTLEWEAIS